MRMYKPISKLPRWQRDSSPSYRRAPLTRRFRLFIILAITVLLWYRYSRTDLSDKSHAIIIDSKIARPCPIERGKPAHPILPPPEGRVELTERKPVTAPPAI